MVAVRQPVLEAGRGLRALILLGTKSGSSFGICGPAHVVEAECFAGLVWYDATSPDGVAVRVAHRREYASDTRRPETEMTVVYVGAWARDEDNPVYPVGANPKRLLLCPAQPPHADLIAGHRYLFKTAKGWKAGQLWSEYLAFELAAPTGVQVPRCFVAVDDVTGESGALIEFFYGYPNDVPGLRFTHGSDITQAVITDKKKGRPHSIPLNVRFCRRYGINDPEIWWGQVLAFDALIGDTDRHPDNWGLLVRLGVEGALPQYRMAPAFDNGTSLAYEIPDDRLPSPKDQKWFDRYTARGTHHAGWTLRNNEATPHFEMCTKFLAAYPTAGAAMRNVIFCDELHTSKALASCTAMDVPNRLSQKRADFLGKLLATRRRELERALS